MADNNFGEVIQPTHCSVSGSADKKRLALTFQCQDRTPLTLLLPLDGAIGLQRKLAQALYILTAKPPAADAPAQEPVAVAAE